MKVISALALGLALMGCSVKYGKPGEQVTLISIAPSLIGEETTPVQAVKPAPPPIVAASPPPPPIVPSPVPAIAPPAAQVFAAAPPIYTPPEPPAPPQPAPSRLADDPSSIFPESPYRPDPSRPARDVTSEERAAVEKKVREEMKDPASAIFSERMKIAGTILEGKDSGTGYLVCGRVNGKNSYGGYVGAQPFRASVLDLSGKPFVVTASIASERFDRLFSLHICEQLGIYPPA